jgi:hypothetical protein
MLGYLGLPAGMGQPRLAYLLKAIEEAFGRSGRGSQDKETKLIS